MEIQSKKLSGIFLKRWLINKDSTDNFIREEMCYHYRIHSVLMTLQIKCERLSHSIKHKEDFTSYQYQIQFGKLTEISKNKHISFIDDFIVCLARNRDISYLKVYIVCCTIHSIQSVMHLPFWTRQQDSQLSALTVDLIGPFKYFWKSGAKLHHWL